MRDIQCFSASWMYANLQMTTQHASAEATMAAQVSQIEELKHQLETSATEQSRLTDLNVQQQASIDNLQQQLMELKTTHESTENQLTDSQTLIARLQACVIFLTDSCH